MTRISTLRRGSLAVLTVLLMFFSLVVPAVPPALAQEGGGGGGAPSPEPAFIDSLEGEADTGAVSSAHFGQTLSEAVYGVSWVDGKEGSAAHLDGDTSYIGYAGSLLNPTAGTIRFWWKPDANLYQNYQTRHDSWTDYGGYGTRFMGFLLDSVGWAAAFQGALSLGLNFNPDPAVLNTSLGFGTWNGSFWSYADWSTPAGFQWSSDQWYDVAVTWSATTGKIAVAVDGLKVAEDDYNTPLSNTEPFFLGQAPWSYWPYGPHTMAGAYDELRIYDVALDFPAPPAVWVQSDAPSAGTDAWSVAPGETFSLDFIVGSVSALYGASLDLKFDPAVVEVVYVNQGSLFSGLPPESYAIPVSPWLDGSLNPDVNAQGLLSYAVTLLDTETPGIPVAPEGESLVEVTFQVRDDVDLSQAQQVPIRFTASGGPDDLDLNGRTALVKLATLVDGDSNPETPMVEAPVAYQARDAVVQVAQTPPPVTDDHGNSIAEATPVGIGTTAGVIDPASDVDFFSFAAQAGTQYTIEVQLGTLPDSVLTLYDSNGNVLDENDDADGLELGSRIDWTAPAVGQYYLQVRSYDPSSEAGSYSLVLYEGSPPGQQLTILTDWLPDAVVGADYEYYLSASGGESPYTWSLVSGTLPGGLELDTVAGRIYGTPVAEGIFDFTVQVTDSAGSTATRDLELVVYSPPSPGFWVEPGTVPETSEDIPITIYGQGFGTDVGQVTVEVREDRYYQPPYVPLVKEAQVTAVQDDEISAVIPGGLPAGPYLIEVSVAGQLLPPIYFEVTHVGTYVEPGYPGPGQPLVLPAAYDPGDTSGWADIGNLEVAEPELAVRLVPVGPGQEVTLAPELVTYTSDDVTSGEVDYSLPAGLPSGKYEIWLDITQNGATQSFQLALLVIGDPHIYWLAPQMFPAGAAELGLWMDAANISLDPARVRVLVETASGEVVGESTEVWVDTWEGGSSDYGWVQAVLDLGTGLADGQTYEVVLEVDGVPSLPWPVQATSGAILEWPYQYWYEAGVTDFIVEIPGYNLRSDAYYTVKLVTPSWSENPGQVVAQSSSVEIVNPMATQSAGGNVSEPPYRLEKLSGQAAPYAAQGAGEAQGGTYQVQSGGSWPAPNILRATMHTDAPVPAGEYNLVVDSPAQEIHYPYSEMPGFWVQFTDQPTIYDMQPWDLLPNTPGQVVQLYGFNLEGESFNIDLINETADPPTVVQGWDAVTPLIMGTGEQYLELTLPALAPGDYMFDISWDTGSTQWWLYVGQPPEEQPLAIVTDSLSDATVGSSYSQLLYATGGAPPYTWSLASGSLPDGLSLETVTGATYGDSVAARIYGVPTVTGTFTFEVSVTDAVYNTVSKVFDLTVGAGEVTGQATVTGQVTLQGRAPGSYGGVEVSINTPSGTLATLTDANGNFVLTGVPEGPQELKFFKEKYLIERVDVEVTAGTNTIETVTLLVGDINGNNAVNLQDLTLLASAYRTATGQDRFDSRADLNEDGNVNLQDLTLLATNYRKEGD